MSWDLHPEEMIDKASSLPVTQTPEVGAWHNFMEGAAKVAMQGFAKTARAVDLLGAVGPIVEDWSTDVRTSRALGSVPATMPKTVTAQDRYFKEHDAMFQSAVDYWTPRPNEVGVAGEVAGNLLSMLPQIMLSPSLAVGATQLAQGEDLVREGVTTGKALAVGAVQALGLGAGIWMPILGTNALQRIVIGGAGFNVVQGVATRAASKAILEGDKAAEQFRPFGETELKLDILLGLAFGGLAHISPAQRAQGAKAWEDIGNFLKDSPPSDKAALATLREAQHINLDSLPGTPQTAADLDVHVQRMRAAIESLATDKPVDVENIVKDPAFEPAPIDQAITPENGKTPETIGESPSPTIDTQPRYNPDMARIEQDTAIREAIQEHAKTVAAEEGIPQIPDRKTIAQTIEEQLVQAGRPAEEAKAGATLWQAFFDTTASRYGRTGQELFDRYMKGITGQAGEGPMLAQANRVIQTPEFKNWFGDSKVVDAEGKPMVVYHGTSHDVESFSVRGTNPENDFGKGIYLTNSPDDASANYAGIGQDLSSRIERLAEQIANDNDWNYDDPRALSKAKKKLHGGADNVMPLYVRMGNPLELGNGSYMEERVARKIANYVRKAVGDDVRHSEIGSAVERLYEYTYDGGRVDDVIKQARDALIYHEDSKGNMDGHDILRKAVQHAGFDGIIDRTVNKKWGDESDRNSPMEGVDADTVHYIAFKPEQIKSATGNRGTFNPNNPNILFQGAVPWYHSELERQIGTAKMGAASPKDWKNYIKGLSNKGVKADEVKWTGLEEWLDLQPGKVTKEQIQQYMKDGGVKVEETTLGEDSQEMAALRKEIGALREDIIDKQYQFQDSGYLYREVTTEIFNELPPEWQAKYQELNDIRDRYNKLADQERDDSSPTKFATYQLPGGENYRELLLTLPEGGNGLSEAENQRFKYLEHRRRSGAFDMMRGPLKDELQALKDKLNPPAQFRSSHFTQPNILAHIRFNERTDADGKKVLFIEEIQSDWAQKGKKEGFAGEKVKAYEVSINGKPVTAYETRQEADDHAQRAAKYNDPASITIAETMVARNDVQTQKPPQAPFVGKTEAWVGLSLKRMIRYAAENGFDRVAWTNGEQQAARYDLSKQVSHINYGFNPSDKTFNVMVMGLDGKGEIWSKMRATPAELEEVIGKDIVQKMADGAGQKSNSANGAYEKRLGGIDLKVGGEGMKAFYDKIVPNVANDVLKKLGGGRVGEVRFGEKKSGELEKGWTTEQNEEGLWDIKDPSGNVMEVEFNEQAARRAIADFERGETVAVGDAKGLMPSQQPGFDITPSMREKAMDTQALFQPGIPQTETANFKAWSNDAPLITSAAAETHEFKTGQKIVVEAYHGTQRPDRVGEKFLKKRATSGPMAFHTSSPDLASNYAKGKSDTSLAGENQNYEAWFKFKPKGMRSPVDLDRAWYHLSEEERARVAEKLPHVTNMDAEGYTEDTYRLGNSEEYGLAGKGHWDYEIKRAKGNVLQAAKEVWLNSGSLMNSEVEFMQILKLGDFPVKDLSFDDPHAAYPFVYKNYVEMQNPLVTNDIPQSVVDALNAAAKRDRTRPKLGADAWDKNKKTMKDWIAVFNGEDNKYAWTSIPDKVTAVLKELGFDGIVDWAGKSGGNPHPVYIPFEETQVKSAIGNKGKYSKDTNNIMRQEGERGALQFDQQGKMAIALLKSADPSTFLHESGHFFLEVTNDLASQPDAPAAMKQDMQTLYSWFGLKDADTWNNMTLDEKRPYHEQFARGFERYFRDGQAPTPVLKGLFQRFRDWLKAVYQSASQLNVEVSDQVRAVMDRMLAEPQRTEAPPEATRSATPPPPRGGVGEPMGEASVPLTEVQQVREDIMAAEHTARQRWGDAIVDALYEKYAPHLEDAGQLRGMSAIMESLAEDAKPSYLMKTMGPRPKEPQSLIAAIKELGGINTSMRSDIAGPDKKGVPVSLFRKAGKNVDELALLLQEKGFLNEADIANESDNGGINKLMEMIQDEIGGNKHYSERDATQAAALREHDQFMESIDGKGESASTHFTPEEWATIQREVIAEGLAPTAKNVVDADAVSIAMQIDEARVERAAITAADDFDFMAEVREIIDGYKPQPDATAAERGTPTAAEPGTPGPAGQEANASGADRNAGNQGVIAQQAIRMVAENPDLPIAIGKDADGNTTYQSAADFMADASARAAKMRADKGLFEIAAQCYLGGGR